MRRLVTVAIAVTMLSLHALMFWQLALHAVAEAAASTRGPSPEYSLSDHSCLPIQDLEPVW
jgi:hypothetical protein